MEIEAFFMKPKDLYLLCQWGEWVYSAQSWKENRLLCESMFVPIDKWTLTLKNDGKKKLFLWNQGFNVIYPNKENKFKLLNHEKKWDYYVNPSLS